MGGGAPKGKGPQRLEEVAKAVGGGYCRLQTPLRPALGVRGTVGGRSLGALERGGGDLPPFQCSPAFPPPSPPCGRETPGGGEPPPPPGPRGATHLQRVEVRDDGDGLAHDEGHLEDVGGGGPAVRGLVQHSGEEAREPLAVQRRGDGGRSPAHHLHDEPVHVPRREGGPPRQQLVQDAPQRPDVRLVAVLLPLRRGRRGGGDTFRREGGL